MIKACNKSPNVDFIPLYYLDKHSLREHPFLLALRRETPSATKSKEKRMFSQAMISTTTLKPEQLGGQGVFLLENELYPYFHTGSQIRLYQRNMKR